MNEIPYGYCHCGCGQKTKIATKTQTKNGAVKGEPRHFIKNHHNNIRQPIPVSERFWSKVDRSGGDNACWNWMAGLKKDGYGQFHINGHKSKNLGAHRFAYELSNGVPPGNLLVCHSCDNPKCCNPAHLFLGTTLDNVRDKIKKGRGKPGGVIGEQSPHHKLNIEQVRYIRNRFAVGDITKAELSRQMGVGATTISDIINYKKWRSVA